MGLFWSAFAFSSGAGARAGLPPRKESAKKSEAKCGKRVFRERKKAAASAAAGPSREKKPGTALTSCQKLKEER